VILDKNLEFSDAQAETTQAAHDSTTVLDLGVAAPNIGAGTPVWLVIRVNEAVTSDGSATVTFDVQDSANNSAFASIGLLTGAIAKATLVAGYVVMKVPLPASIRRYVKIVYTIGTAALTAGKFDAFLTLDPEVAA